MSDEKNGPRTACFITDGTPGPSKTAGGYVSIQGILPDISQFKYAGPDVEESVMCDKWQLKTTYGSRVNTYTLWVSKATKKPIKYDMIGFDSLIGSHYDRYYLIYENFDNTIRPNPIVFEVPNNASCGGFPGPGIAAEHRLSANPMRQFIHNDESHLEPMFQHFQKLHKKVYKDAKEHGSRKDHFRQNVRFVHSKNRAGLSFKLRINHLADRSDAERRRMRGRLSSKGYNGGKPFHMEKYKTAAVPTSLDWRIEGAVTPVKDQAICGSCWSFGTTGAVEGQYFVKHGMRIRLSQQQLMDCSWGFGNNACDGGEDFRAYEYILKHGLSTEDSYGAYLGADGVCHANLATAAVHISGYVNVTTKSVPALKMALFNEGPISISIDASHKSLSFYDHGVYFEPKCGNGPDQLDHSVLAVGYGTLNGKAYWLVKNSWSFYWGNDGYVLMAQKDNNCGVLTAPTFVNIV